MQMPSAPTAYGAADVTALYSPRGERKYLTRDERTRFLTVLGDLPIEHALFIETLFYSGARISEVLSLTPVQFSVAESKVAIRTLKRRRLAMREVALPDRLLAALDMQYALGSDHANPHRRLWPWHRVTGWRIVRHAFARAGLIGLAATPRGLRHSFGIAGVEARIPVTLVQKWLGHARLETTSIYLGLVGADEVAIASRMWRSADRTPTAS